MALWRSLKRAIIGKTVLTPEEMGLVAVPAAFNAAKAVMEIFNEETFVDEISTKEQLCLSVEVLAFTLTCETISLSSAFGMNGTKAAEVLARETFTAFAKNLGMKDVPDFVESVLQEYCAHYNCYAGDIIERFKAGNTAMGAAMHISLGMKILRQILSPVFDLPLTAPESESSLTALEEAQMQYSPILNKVRHAMKLASALSIHAFLYSLPQKAITDEIILSAD